MTVPDHYSVLGVLPTADDVVIRAAYRALAQRYHPDKWQGDPKEATKKMAEINAAYATLSDRDKRAEYDRSEANTTSDNIQFNDDSRAEQPSTDPLSDKWEIAVSVYPDLVVYNKMLEKYSWRLAFAFRAYLLAEKEFENRIKIAVGIEDEYLERYFGKNAYIKTYAKRLITEHKKDAALELNKIVSVMGSNSDPDRIIKIVNDKYHPFEDEESAYYRSYPL